MAVWLVGGVLFADTVAAKSRPPTCTAGRYVPTEATGSDDAAPFPHVVELRDDGTVSVGDGCPAVVAKLRGLRRGGTRLAAKWPKGACRALRGKAKLRARIDAGCITMRGELRMEKRRRSFTAALARCDATAADVVEQGRTMTELCHVPPGNFENAHTIVISKNAVSAHLDQHPCDHLGACGDYFPNGVASGDVSQSAVTLWARGETLGAITFEYGTTPDLSGTPVGAQTVTIDDPTVPAKLDVSGLIPGTQYYYRACRGDRCQSECPVAVQLGSEAHGQFRTPHENGRNGLRFGVSSCWRGDLKPFEAIKNAPDRDLDFFVALGDTTYADSDQTGPGRIPEGVSKGEYTSILDGFRKKNECQYRARSCVHDDTSVHDNIFAKLRASTAQYVTIDDHEVVNDFAGGASPRSQRNRHECLEWGLCFCPDVDPNGDCSEAFVNDTDLFEWGMQAWHEYNPVRDDRYGQTGDSRTALERKLYRYRTFGTDAAIFMLDTRSFREGPIEIVDGFPYVALPPQSYERGRTMLGSAQLTDLLRDLQDAEDRGITWKFVLVPEPIQHIGWLFAPDRFEGYARERGQILDFIQSFCLSNVVFISGDIHATLTNNLIYKKDFLALERYSEAWDISTGSVAYGEPYAQVLVEGLNAVLDACGGDPVCESQLPPGIPDEGFELLPPEAQNALAETLLNGVLDFFRYPRVGLGADKEYPLFLQKENAHVPATPLFGPYSALATWGWSEFAIDADTQVLTVTTYGLDPDATNVSQVPVWSQFEVAPRVRAGNGASCDHDTDCASCRCSPLRGECTAGLANGELCVTDDQCRSDRCSILGLSPPIPECQPKRPNGATCLTDDDCLAGDCAPYSDALDLRCWPIPDGKPGRPEAIQFCG